jgi:uncharacterized protein YaaN involved in tellurite resistance
MSETNPQTQQQEQPMDLSAFMDLGAPESSAPQGETALAVVEGSAEPLSEAQRALLEPQKPAPQLVDLRSLPPEELQKAQQLSLTLDFARTSTTLSFVEDALKPVTDISRRLLSDTTIGDAGEVGRIAAAVIDGIKILRIEDLQREAQEIAPKATGLLGKFFGAGKLAGSAIKGFAENRKKFLEVMDQESARARRAKADLTTTVELLDQQALAVRQSVGNLTRGIAAAQIALERGAQEAEALRQKAIASGSTADAAVAMDYRNTLSNFRAKVGDMKESLISAATLIPIIASNRKAAETRIMKISNGLMLTMPRLMALASQAVVEVRTTKSAQEAERLSEANRQVMALAGKSAHDSAVAAERAKAGDERDLQALSALADQTIETMREVLEIEKENEQKMATREQELVKVRDRLVEGMRSVQAIALSTPVPGAAAQHAAATALNGQVGGQSGQAGAQSAGLLGDGRANGQGEPR